MNQNSMMKEPCGPWCLNGRYLLPNEAHIPITSPLVQWGYGVYTTGKMVQGKLFGKKEHLKRLFSDGQAIGIKISNREILEHNLTKWLSFFETISTPICVKIIIQQDGAFYFLAFHMDEQIHPLPVRLLLTATGLLPKTSPWSQYKSASRAEYMFLKKQAQDMGYDDLLLYRENYHIVETTSSAIWFMHNDTLFFPDPKLHGMKSISASALQNGEIAWEYWTEGLSNIPEKSRLYTSNALRGVQMVHSITLDDSQKTIVYTINPEEHKKLNQELWQILDPNISFF